MILLLLNIFNLYILIVLFLAISFCEFFQVGFIRQDVSGNQMVGLGKYTPGVFRLSVISGAKTNL
jgi:hypothetical protein